MQRVFSLRFLSKQILHKQNLSTISFEKQVTYGFVSYIFRFLKQDIFLAATLSYDVLTGKDICSLAMANCIPEKVL